MRKLKKRFHPHAWLWWMAIFILIIGLGSAYIVKLDVTNPSSEYLIRKILAMTAVGSGLCIIAALGQWFIKR